MYTTSYTFYTTKKKYTSWEKHTLRNVINTREKTSHIPRGTALSPRRVSTWLRRSSRTVPQSNSNPSTPPNPPNGSLPFPPLPPVNLHIFPRLAVPVLPQKTPLPPLRAPLHPIHGRGFLLPNPRHRSPVRETRSPRAENDTGRGARSWREEAEGRYEGGVL